MVVDAVFSHGSVLAMAVAVEKAKQWREWKNGEG